MQRLEPRVPHAVAGGSDHAAAPLGAGGRRRTSWGPVWRAAIRRRPGQALALVLLSALVTAGIVVTPLITRLLEQGVVKPAVTLRPGGARVTVYSSPGRPDVDPARVAAFLPPTVTAILGPPVTSVETGHGRTGVTGGPAGSVDAGLGDRPGTTSP